MGLSFEVVVSGVDEELEKIEKVTRRETERLVVKLAKGKAKGVFEQLKDRGKNFLIIAADTLIWFDNKIYGKPRDLGDAFATLSLFRGKIHWAFTGLVLKGRRREKAICTKAKVYMKKISDEELQKYVETKEPLGKAGSYAIFQKADKFFKVLEGEPSTVAGLPIERLKELLPDFGI